MRTLYLLRHAKSSWDDASLSDSERPLNPRGQRDAPRMGRALGSQLSPMTFHISPAERARQTFLGLQPHWPGLTKEQGVVTPALYTFNYRGVLDWVAQQPGAQRHLALVGHNPAFTELINYLAGPGTLDNLPTAGWAELSLALDDWSKIHGEEGKGRLVFRLFPKDLQDEAR